MSEKCEPPEELRGVDGWHWVQWNNDAPECALWIGGFSWEHEDFGDRGWRYISPILTPTESDALRAERDAAKRRADNHAETLRGIARMDPKTEADRMVLWATDGLSGYLQSAEKTLKDAYDERNTLRARVAVLEEIARAADVWRDAANTGHSPILAAAALTRAVDTLRAALSTGSET